MTFTTFRNLYLEGVLFLTASFLFTIFLFYIDEGRYSLDGILAINNLVALSIYFVGAFIGQWLLFYSLSQKMEFVRNLTLSIPGGLLLGVFISIGIIYTIQVSWQMIQ